MLRMKYLHSGQGMCFSGGKMGSSEKADISGGLCRVSRSLFGGCPLLLSRELGWTWASFSAVPRDV